MTPRRPIPLRWAEEAEAEQVCALAVLEPEVESGAARPVCCAPQSYAPQSCSPLWPSLLRRWLSLLAGARAQIDRDEERQHSLY
jgi:hypothetical protein